VPDRLVFVIMGVSGSGKTTVGETLAGRLGWDYAEADAFHSEANLAKMASGQPLDDADREPWLAAIARWIDDRIARGVPGVVTCSALRRAYRDLLRRPQVQIVYLAGAQELIAQRLAARHGHFFPPAMLASQLAALEPPALDEGVIEVDIDRTPAEIVDAIIAATGATGAAGSGGGATGPAR
jgi:gluconokinase